MTPSNLLENWPLGNQAQRRINIVWKEMPEEKTLVSIYKKNVPELFEDVKGKPDVNAMRLFIYLLCEIGFKAYIVVTPDPDGQSCTIGYPEGGLTVDFQDIHANCKIEMTDALRSLAILLKHDLLEVVQGNDGHLKVRPGAIGLELEKATPIDYVPGRVWNAAQSGSLTLDLQP